MLAFLVAGALAAAEPWCAVTSATSTCTTPMPFHASVGAPSFLDPMGRGLWLIDGEHDEVVLMLETGTSRRYKVGRWPESIVVAASGRVFVSSRESGRIDVIDPDHRQLHVAVGDEPRSLALDEDRGLLYVALVTEKAIVALDAKSLLAVARVDVAHAPVSIAMTPAGLAVVSDRDPSVRFFDAGLKEEVRRVNLPGRNPAGLSPRLLVPAGDGLMLIADRARTGIDAPVSFGGYGGAQSQPIDTVVFAIESLGHGYQPAFFVTAIHADDPVAGIYRDGILHLVSRNRGSIVSLGYSWGTRELSNALETRPKLWKFVADTEPALRRYVDEAGFPISLRPDLTGAVVMPSGALAVTDALGRRVLHLSVATDLLALRMDHTKFPRSIGRDITLFQQDFVDALPMEGFQASPFTRTADPVDVVPSRVQALAPGTDVELRVGQALFHAGLNQRISGNGLACASCHPDGREDGRVWSQQGTRRQTPMLTHRLAETGPFNWLGSARTLEQNLSLTMTERLSGVGLRQRELTALTRFVRDGLRPVVQPAPKAPELVAMGRELFNDATVGCAACHPADFETTDNERHNVGTVGDAERREFSRAHPPPGRPTMLPHFPMGTGLGTRSRRIPAMPAFVPRKFDTPSLKSIALTAPYFHNGSEASLASLIDNNGDRMGTTSHLDATQRRALVAYLETL